MRTCDKRAMRERRHGWLTYANVMATVAVFIALGGGAYAAGVLPVNSVGAAQLKKNAVTSSKVKDGSLVRADFRRGSLPSGATGRTGAQGATGAQGPVGPAGAAGAPGPAGKDGDDGIDGEDGFAYTAVNTDMLRSDLGQTVTKTVTCEPGEVATGGGYAGTQATITILDSAPTGHDPVSSPNGWSVRAHNNYGDAYEFTVYVVCAA